MRGCEWKIRTDMGRVIYPSTTHSTLEVIMKVEMKRRWPELRGREAGLERMRRKKAV